MSAIEGDEEIVITISGSRPRPRGSTINLLADTSTFHTETVPAATGAAGILAALHGLRFWVKNPLEHPVHVVIEPALPAPLLQRQWVMAVSSHGGARFRLDAGGERRVRLAMTPGRQIWPAALADPTARDIVVTVIANSALAGALTYRLDPDRVTATHAAV